MTTHQHSLYNTRRSRLPHSNNTVRRRDQLNSLCQRLRFRHPDASELSADMPFDSAEVDSMVVAVAAGKPTSEKLAKDPTICIRSRRAYLGWVLLLWVSLWWSLVITLLRAVIAVIILGRHCDGCALELFARGNWKSIDWDGINIVMRFCDQLCDCDVKA